MTAIDNLISQIQDEALRNKIQEEVSKMAKQKKFGLVFEDHIPEGTPLYDMPIEKGCNVMRRDSKDDKTIYVVLKIEGDTAVCIKPERKDEAVTFELKDIVRVAKFGESIYPYLKPLDSVCNAPDSDLWHTLIEADNYHALQLLEYLYAGKVDCIYIDPPYNTGAKDWKYNNDYVDGNDAYRHSKWLSFMQRRLQLAKKLLNPADSVLIVTIDEKEYLHLGCLLEELFPEARMQMISSVINPAGAGKKEFARTDEYIFFLRFGSATLMPESREENDVPVVWDTLRRSSLANARGKHGKGACGPNQFYPFYVNTDNGRIVKIGEPISEGVDRNSVPQVDGCIAVFPVRPNGIEMNWGIKPDEAKSRFEAGYLRAGAYKPKEPQKYVISYLTGGIIKDIEAGTVIVDGYNDDGSVNAYYPSGKDKYPSTNWNRPTHDAQRYGTNILTSIIGNRFPYPKSIYAVKDSLGFFLKEKPYALILDFFAGSGTTMHAVNLLNAEDGGHKRCIMVTNNEVSADEAKMLKDKGYQPGDVEWEKLGIAHYVTWPRTVCSIEGHDVNGKSLKGDYLGSEPPMHMADGFKANAAFFKLGFLDPTAVSLGMRFSEMLPTLWLKTGAKGKCPELTGEQVPDMLILPENQFAVLINENTFADFAEKLAEHPEIQTVFLATDYEVNYQSMVKNLNVENAYQLYRDYLDHFRVNRGRN